MATLANVPGIPSAWITQFQITVSSQLCFLKIYELLPLLSKYGFGYEIVYCGKKRILLTLGYILSPGTLLLTYTVSLHTRSTCMERQKGPGKAEGTSKSRHLIPLFNPHYDILDTRSFHFYLNTPSIRKFPMSHTNNRSNYRSMDVLVIGFSSVF